MNRQTNNGAPIKDILKEEIMSLSESECAEVLLFIQHNIISHVDIHEKQSYNKNVETKTVAAY